jgi:hypothetical protein
MREVIQCLIDWLNDNPSETKAHRILLALAVESLNKADSADEKRRFDSLDIVAAANESKNNSSDANDWIDWKRTVVKYWETRELQIIDSAKKRGLKFYPKPDRISTQGGPDLTTYLIKAEPLPEIINEAEPSQEQSDKETEQQTTVHYGIAENGKVKPAWGVRWLLNKGEIRLSIGRIWAILIALLILGGSTLLFSYISLIAFAVPKPVTTRELSNFLFIFVLPYTVWIFFIRPWKRLFDDRIVPAPEILVSIKEKQAQLELFRDGDLRLIRLVHYSAPCPICGATIEIEDGSPDFPRRLVGRCSESPREHVYSFDRVTRRGIVLRSPIN